MYIFPIFLAYDLPGPPRYLPVLPPPRADRRDGRGAPPEVRGGAGGLRPEVRPEGGEEQVGNISIEKRTQVTKFRKTAKTYLPNSPDPVLTQSGKPKFFKKVIALQLFFWHK